MRNHILALASALVLVAIATTARGQPAPRAPVVRADLLGTLAWVNTHAGDVDTYDDWDNQGVYGGVAAGWYWTDHLKTDLEWGVSSKTELYGARPIVVNGYYGYAPFVRSRHATRLAIAQRYQFFRNAWFHPDVGAGAELAWVTQTTRFEPAFLYNPAGGVPRQVAAAPTEGPDTTLEVRPFVDVGFKAYMSPRVFFRGSARVSARHGIEDVLLRFGAGVDF